MEILAFIGGIFLLMVVGGVVKGFLNAKSASDELDRRYAGEYVARPVGQATTKSQRLADAEYRASAERLTTRQDSRTYEAEPDRYGDVDDYLDGKRHTLDQLAVMFTELSSKKFPDAGRETWEDMGFWMARGYQFDKLASPAERIDLRAAAMRSLETLEPDQRQSMLDVPWQKSYLQMVGIA